ELEVRGIVGPVPRQGSHVVKVHSRIESQHTRKIAEAPLAAAFVSEEHCLAQPRWQPIRSANAEATCFPLDLSTNKVLEVREKLSVREQQMECSLGNRRDRLRKKAI